MRSRVFVTGVFVVVGLPGLVMAQQPPAPANAQKDAEPPVYQEVVVVTASRTEQQSINAPAAISVVSIETIATTQAGNMGDLLRAVPGVNVTQTSARDVNLTTRGATGTLATSQLAFG